MKIIAGVWHVLALPMLSLITALACASTSPEPADVQDPPPFESLSGTTTVALGYTYHRPDGNRLASGQGALPGVAPIDIPLDGVPLWLVAAASESEAVWVAVLQDGRVLGFAVSASGWKPIAVAPDRLHVGMPPLLRLEGGEAHVVTVTAQSASPLTHPSPVDAQDRLAYIDAAGGLAFKGGAEASTLQLNALPDARILHDGSGRLLLLAGATTRYAHGALGDTVESDAIVLVDAKGTPTASTTITITGAGVVEGISPIWADLDGDGIREIIVTVSDAAGGGRIVVYDENGHVMAEGPAVGAGFRWRHQIAVAPFGPNRETELAVMLTPHIGGTVEFYRMRGGTMDIVARLPGPTSHINGSRNLDMALAGDVDGDGRTELLVLSRGLTKLVGVRRTVSGAEEAWSVEAGGRVTTNIAAAETAGGGMAIGVGHSGGILRIWSSTGSNE